MSNHQPIPAWLFNLYDQKQGIARKLAEGLQARIFVGENIMLSVVNIDPHSEGKIHSHVEEQWGLLIAGECIRIQDGEEIAVSTGDFWYTPSNVLHGIRTGASSALVLDIFSPPRQEYKQGGEGFGKVAE